MVSSFNLKSDVIPEALLDYTAELASHRQPPSLSPCFSFQLADYCTSYCT
jgi:hypothetical protein